MQGLTQDYQLTLPAIMRRAEQLYGEREIVTRRPTSWRVPKCSPWR